MSGTTTDDLVVDTNAIAAELGNELAEGLDSGGAGTGDASPAGAVGGLPPSAPATAPAPAPNLRPLPKAWKKEMEAHWSKLPPEIHDYVYDREADVSRGFQMYRDAHENWNGLLQPYQQLLQQYPDLKPRELLNNLMQSHLALTFGTPEQKLAIGRQLLTAYGLDPSTLVDGSQPNPLASEVQSLRQRLETFETGQRQQAYQTNLSKVEAFFADPKNKYAAELGDDILQLVARGETLESAYEKAQWLNSTVRAKLIAEQSRTAPSAGSLNVGTGSAAPPPPAPRKGQSIDESIDQLAHQLMNASGATL